MSEFTPVQLDAIEDALEELDALGVPPTAGAAGGPAVAQRLDEYREILQWTRDAMPLQEVRPGLLDGVLEEARSLAPVAVSAPEPAAPTTSWWKKLRGVFVVPALAVAGSAALVLLLVRPGAKEEADETVAARGSAPERAEAKLAGDAAPPRQLEASEPAGALQNGIADASVDQELSRGRLRLEEEKPVDRGAAAIEGEADARAQAAPPKAPAVEPPPPPPASSTPEPSTKKKAKPSDKIYYDEGGEAPKQKGAKTGGAGGAPGGVVPQSPQADREPEPEPTAKAEEAKKDAAPSDGDSAGAWGTIAAADQQRRAGDCSAARSKYKPLTTAKDHRVRARALAGLGLCETNEKAAENWFGKARKADPDIAGFIAHERGTPAQADQAESSL